MSSLFKHPMYPTVHYVLIISLVLTLSFYVSSLTSQFNSSVSGYAVIEEEQNDLLVEASEELYSARSYYFYITFILLLTGIIIALSVSILSPLIKKST